MIEPQVINRDINDEFGEFLEQIVINCPIPTYTDPYSSLPIGTTTTQIPLMVSWHDVTTEKLVNDNVGSGVLGILQSGDAYAIYQGVLNLFDYQLPTSTVIRRGITYVVEINTNPSANRWVIGLKRKR